MPKQSGKKASVIVQRKTGPAKTRTQKIEDLMAQLHGIEIDLANLAGAGFQKSDGLIFDENPMFINHFNDSFTQGGQWWDTFADAPDNTNSLAQGMKQLAGKKPKARSKKG